MKAQQLAEVFGESLIGQKLYTFPMGEWPGGYATVIEMLPDPGAPEIVFQVESETHGDIGVYGHEEVGYVMEV